MPWTKKASAPATFNLQDAVAALITGDATWGWLLQWLPLLPAVIVDTATMCAAGPRAITPLVKADFVSDPTAAFDRALSQLGPNIDRIQSAAYDRVFGAYCESITPAGGTYTWFFSGGPDVNTYLGGVNGWAIPPGATKVRITRLTNDTGGFSDLHHVGYTTGVNTCNPTGPAMMPALGASVLSDLSVCPTIDHAAWRTAGTGGTFSLEWFFPGGGSIPHVPTPQPQPAGVLAPTSRTYATTADLGAELDRQELKLDVILAAVELLARRGVVGPTTADPPVDAALGPVVAPGAIGYSIAVSGIPAGSTLMFGTPVSYRRIGRYALGSANGWLPSVDLTHSPQLVAPLAPGVDRIQVVVNAPETALVTALYPAKPAG